VQIERGSWGDALKRTSDKKTSVTIDGATSEVLPTPPRIDLKTIDDVRLEMARVYREMRGNSMEAQQGTRLVYVLSQIGKLIEIHEIEQRITALETLNGKS
jgi:hypothetical protein